MKLPFPDVTYDKHMIFIAEQYITITSVNTCSITLYLDLCCHYCVAISVKYG